MCHGYLSTGAQGMQESQMKQQPVQTPVQSPDDASDCLQCLIIMYGETHIDTLVQLLNLTAYAESRYSQRCIRRQR
jgi:hypothetical protein